MPRQEMPTNMRTIHQEATAMDAMPESDEADGGQEPSARRPKQKPIKVDKKVGRNDLCPCGSGKKYKKCHGAGVG